MTSTRLLGAASLLSVFVALAGICVGLSVLMDTSTNCRAERVAGQWEKVCY
jgi:hypothetical protein